MKKIKMGKKQEGITLIALVVTIGVLLILVGAVINIVFSKGGILDRTKSAAKMSTAAKEKEMVEMAYAAVSSVTVDGEVEPEDLQAELANMVGADEILTDIDDDGYLTVIFLGTGNEYNISEMGVSKLEETFSEIATETRIYTDENGKTAIIPKGFAVGTSSTINKVKNGLVIQDEDGNQFVWIPATGYVGNGFYLGRYEAGTENERTEKTTTNSNPLVQRDKYVYNYVNFDEATSLCESMYNNLDSVESDLPNIQDLNAIKSFIPQYNTSQRREMGNYYNSKFEVIRGKYAMITNGATTPYSPYYNEDTKLYKDVKGVFTKPTTTQVIFTTGASDENKVNNIFDIFGNVAEWNDEVLNTSGEIVTGGSFITQWRTTVYMVMKAVCLKIIK